MNFNTDDPLADLLSDNSNDNDSFFENTASKKLKNLGKANKAKSKLEDLFGIDEENESDFRGKQRSSGLPKASSTPRITKQRPSQSHDDDDRNADDDDLGFDPKKPKAAAPKASNLLDDLLGALEKKRPATAAAATTTKPTMSRQSTDTTTDTSNFLLSQARPKTSTGRRSSGNSVAVNADPLGLFHGAATRDREPVSSSGMSTPKTNKRGTTADWLGLGSSTDPAETTANRRIEEARESPKKTVNPTAQPAATSESRDVVEIFKSEQLEPMVESSQDTISPKAAPRTPLATTNTAQNILLLNNMTMETKNAFAALQQQESQLSLATQLKNQEKALLEMQHKQHTLLKQQEHQFQDLLQQQIHRQQQMEQHIQSQQQRINTHIQLLMTQPAVLTETVFTDKVAEAPAGDAGSSVAERHDVSRQNHAQTALSQDTMEVVQMEADLKRLGLEKLRLEELVESMKINYEKEIDIIEASYKKQLKVVEEHTTKMDARLKADIDELTVYYTKKLELVESDKQKLKSDYVSQLVALKQEHEDELRKLKKSQEDDLEMLKEEHRRMLESIRQSKLLEFAAVQDNGTYLDTLRLATNNLETLSGGLQDLRNEMQFKIDTLNKEKEKSLEARERKVEDSERRLKITEETAEDEKRRLMELVSSLELQLMKLSKESSEENWLLRQKVCALEVEKAAFEREKEYSRQQIARDEQRVAELKEMQLAEQQRIMLELQDERARLLVERTQIETSKKLQLQPNDLERERMEVDASLKIAQEATQQADVERQRYHKMQRQLEKQKRELIDREHTLRAKEDELDQELSSFRLAEQKSQEASHKAHLAEQNFQMKIQFLQQRMREIGNKEANLSQDRVLLTQERISLQNAKLRLAERKCTLCKMGERSEEIKHIVNAVGTAVIEGDDAVAASRTNDGGDGAKAMTKPDKIPYRQRVGDGNIVDRILDESIADSMRKMKTATNIEFWSDSVLDDDSKELALNNRDMEVQLGAYDIFKRTL